MAWFAGASLLLLLQRGCFAPLHVALCVCARGSGEAVHGGGGRVLQRAGLHLGEPSQGGSSHLCRGEGVFVSMESVLDSEPLRLGELAVMPLPVPPLWVPTLLMSLHDQQSDH